MNQTTGEYLKYAVIQVVGTGKSTISEDGGVYMLTNLPAGEVKLNVAYTGLDTQEIAILVPASGSVKQDFNLKSTEYGDTIALGAFRVASAREGNAKAIVLQKSALNFKTIVAADAFGDVAEGNVGEFLKLLPGVSIDYVDNDARSTRIRGLPPKYATTTMDGLPIANSGSNNLSAQNQGRWLELEQLSMAALDIIETTKTPTPDMMGMNLAGNVNAISKSAFNQKGRSITYQGSVNFNQWYGSFAESKGWDNSNHDKALPGGKLEWIDTFLEGKLGMVLSAAHSGAFADQRVTIGTQTWDKNAYNNGQELPLINTWNFQDGLKPTWRDSLLANFDFKASEDLKFSLRTNYGYYRSEFYNRNWLVNANTTNLTTYTADGTLDRSSASPGTINQTTTSATSLGSSTTSYARILGSNQRKSGGTLNISPAASWNHENLKVEVAGNYSIGKTAYACGQDGYFSLVQADMQRVSWQYERLAADDVHIQQISTGSGVSLSNQGSVFDLSNYNTGGSVEQTTRNSKAQLWSGKADVSQAFPDWALPTTFKTGVADSLELRDVHTLQAKWNMALTSGPTSTTAINLDDFRDPYDGNVGVVTDINGVTSKTPAADKWRLYQLFQSYGNTDPFSTAKNGPFTAQYANNLRNMLQNDVDIKEDIDAAYAMATVDPTKAVNITGGFRFEKTHSQGRGFDDIGNVAAAAISGTTNKDDINYIYARYGHRITRERTYNNTLPVLEGRDQIAKNLILRAAYYGSLLRPDFQNVVGGITAADNAAGNGYDFMVNNTKVKPETAGNLDASVEYYFEPVGIVSASIFYKDIQNIQITIPKTNISTAPQEVKDQILAAGFDDSEFANPNSTFATTINGPRTSMWGYELAYNQELAFLPAQLKGFGVTVNFSHYEPKEKRLWALVPNAGDGMPLNQGNFILRYKLNKFKMQTSATWTEKRLTGNSLSGLVLNPDGTFTPVNATQANVTNYQSGRWIISTSVEYALHRYATLFADVNNVFNSAKENYAENSTFTTRDGNYGASINVGVKGQF
jgi:TonB-dependent receptor